MEQRTLLELERAVLRAIYLRAGQVRWQQVRGKLDSMKFAFDAVGQYFDRTGLGEARRSLDQQVTIGQQCNQ